MYCTKIVCGGTINTLSTLDLNVTLNQRCVGLEVKDTFGFIMLNLISVIELILQCS